MMIRENSNKLYEEAKEYFPGGVNSPVRAFKSVEGSPLFIKSGRGSKIVDEDDNTYIDYCCSWGPLIHGHDHTIIRQAVIDAVIKGTSFGTPNAIGNEIGRLIIENNRFVEKLRFVCSGTEAVMSALRLARGYTGKNKIIKFEGCYHGHVDSLLVKAGSGLITFGESTSAGIPESFAKETIVLPLNDLSGLRNVLDNHHDDIAAIIIEPVPANNGLLIQNPSFLIGLRELCSEYGVLLIFDEVISGFRLGFEGASGYYDIKPDLVTYGKIIGGGMPVGAYGGRADIMAHIAPDGPVYQAGTLSANPVTLAAGLASLKLLLEDGFYDALKTKARRLKEVIDAHVEQKGYGVSVVCIGSIFWISFTSARILSADQIDSNGMKHFKKLHTFLLSKGIYLGPSGYEVGFISSAHTMDDIEKTAKLICQGLDSILSD